MLRDFADCSHIRKGGRYRILGIVALIPAIAASFIAVKWTPSWPWWGYYLTFFPATLGYSVFLCCQLSEPCHCLWSLIADHSRAHLGGRQSVYAKSDSAAVYGPHARRSARRVDRRLDPDWRVDLESEAGVLG